MVDVLVVCWDEHWEQALAVRTVANWVGHLGDWWAAWAAPSVGNLGGASADLMGTLTAAGTVVRLDAR